MVIRHTMIAFAAVGPVVVTHPAGAAGPDAGLNVNVVNTRAHPLPVTGSVAVTGAVSGTVTGTVGLTPGTSVQIGNTVDIPVRVRNVNDAIQSVQATASCLTSALGCLPTIYTVPAGKRLVIEYA